MWQSYVVSPASPRQPVRATSLALVALLVLAGCRMGHRPSPATLGALAAVIAALMLSARGATRLRRAAIGVGAVLAAVVTAGLAAVAWSHATDAVLGPFSGPARLLTDPDRRAAMVRVVIEVEGRRYEVWAGGSPGRRLEARSAGEVVWVAGERLGPGRSAERLAVAHVVGRLRVERVGAWSSGRPLDRAANRARALVSDGVRGWPPAEASLFLGLVLGDDRDEPDSMVAAFRASGLAHLTAASGQNIAFVLAGAGPLLRRVRPGWRLGATLALIGWFVVLTRAEPSVLRAAAMAALGVVALTFGRDGSPLRSLALATIVLVTIDPLLAWSVSFLLSVGATAGLVILTRRIEPLLPGPVWLRAPVAVTMAAQIGVSPVALAAFGTLPVVAIPANLLAVPVAAAVMLVGLPLAMVAGALPAAVAGVVTWPVLGAVRWVWTVAELGARSRVPGAVDAVAWALLLVVIAWVGSRRGRAPAHR
jgi:competence protein ComEC